MEKEILEILKAMQQDIKGLKESQERLENKIDGVVEQTAYLLEFRTKITDTVQQIKSDVEAIKKDVTNVEVITASNWADIAKLKAVKYNDKKVKFRVDVHEISLFLFLFINTKQKRENFNKITPYKWLKIVKKCNFAKTKFSEIIKRIFFMIEE